MPVFNFSELNSEYIKMLTDSDPETGCTVYNDKVAFEQCRQSYFLKQQNNILQGSTSGGTTSNQITQELLIENNTLKSEIAQLKSQNNFQPSYYLLSLILITLLFIAWRITKEKYDCK